MCRLLQIVLKTIEYYKTLKEKMAIIKFAILTMIGTVIRSIVLMGSELDAAASQNNTSITNDTSSNIQGHLIYEVHGKIVAQKLNCSGGFVRWSWKIY